LTSGEVCVEPGDIVHHELLGFMAEVVDSTNRYLVGIKGRVVDETRNTLVLDAGEEKRLPKAACTFTFTTAGGQKVRVDGTRLVGRPEDRIPKRRKRRG